MRAVPYSKTSVYFYNTLRRHTQENGVFVSAAVRPSVPEDLLTQEAVYTYRNIGARSRNHRYSSKAISIVCSECVWTRSYTACSAHAPSCPLWPVRLCRIFQHLIKVSKKIKEGRLKNEHIKEVMGVKGKQNIMDIIEKKRLQWYGHVKRIPEERIPKLIVECTPPERRKEDFQEKRG